MNRYAGPFGAVGSMLSISRSLLDMPRSAPRIVHARRRFARMTHDDEHTGRRRNHHRSHPSMLKNRPIAVAPRPMNCTNSGHCSLPWCTIPEPGILGHQPAHSQRRIMTQVAACAKVGTGGRVASDRIRAISDRGNSPGLLDRMGSPEIAAVTGHRPEASGLKKPQHVADQCRLSARGGLWGRARRGVGWRYAGSGPAVVQAGPGDRPGGAGAIEAEGVEHRLGELKSPRWHR